MHPHIVSRALALLLLAGCTGQATAPAELPSGSFALRAVRDDRGAPVPVPATFPMAAQGDSTRWVAGAFTLHAEGRWSVRFEQELVAAGGAARGRVLELGGDFAVQEEAAGGQRVLNLYPGRPVTADRPWTAVLRGDTVHYGAGVFVR